MKYEGLIEYAKEHTTKECAEHYNCSYKCMNNYLCKHNISHKLENRKGRYIKYACGETETRLYQIWVAMRYRCNNKNNRHYGAKGINVCKDWNDFNNFKAWSLAQGYNDSLTIDRIDNCKGYCPDNCRWVDNYIQHNNQGNNRYITYKDKTRTIAQWAKELELNGHTLYSRLQRGWSIERALETDTRR